MAKKDKVYVLILGNTEPVVYRSLKRAMKAMDVAADYAQGSGMKSVVKLVPALVVE